jgi:hypothetical protein
MPDAKIPGSKPERRSRQRVPARLPVSITAGKDTPPASGYTRDLSMSGIFLYTDSPIHPGSALEVVLILPPELTQGEKRWVCCQAAVVRVEGGREPGKSGYGVAASIQSMQILPEAAG